MHTNTRKRNHKSFIYFLTATFLTVSGFLCLPFSHNFSSAYFGGQTVPDIPLQCNNLLSPPPEKIYVLIDESFSANAHDPSAELRYSVADRIVEFASAYGWVAQEPPQIFVYQYSTKFSEKTGYTNQLWPQVGDSPALVIEKPIVLNESYIGDIVNVMDSQKYTRSGGRVENLVDSLVFLKSLISNQTSNKNTMVMIITEGYPLQNGSLESPDALLERAAYVWNEPGISTVPVAVVLYSSDPNRLDDFTNSWSNHFLNKLANRDLPIPLPILSLPSNMSEYRNVWNWMVTLYEHLQMFHDGVNVAGIPGNVMSNLIFSQPAASLSVVSYGGDEQEQEQITISDKSAILEEIPNTFSRLDWWNIAPNKDSFEIRGLIKKGVISKFIYHCKSIPLINSNNTFIPPVSPAPSLPTQTPSRLDVNKPIAINTVSGLISLLIMAFSLVFANYMGSKRRMHPLMIAGFMWFVFDLMLIWVIWFEASRNYETFWQSVFTNTLVTLVFGGIAAGSPIILLGRNVFDKPSGKLGKFFMYAAPILGGGFVVLSTISGILIFQ